jgi:NAD(P)-dependent dehydrogenase (short-subunit alcohol dehydrogenase family)
MGRMSRADEIKSVVHFLACDASSLIAGATVKADGGFICW